MVAPTVTCPSCGHTAQADYSSGAPARCSFCYKDLPDSALGSTNKTVLAETEQMVRFTCPRCRKSLESPASFAGTKIHCPDCNQRLQIPKPSPAATAPSKPPVDKTVLAKEELPGAPPSPPPVPQLTASNVSTSMPIAPTASPPPPAKHETCLECGMNISQNSRVQTCPDCGSQFCSARCFRAHHEHAHAPKRKKQPRYVECDRCGSTRVPYERSVISETGWVVFVIMLLFCFPLFWIGLLITEMRVTCADCGARLE